MKNNHFIRNNLIIYVLIMHLNISYNYIDVQEKERMKYVIIENKYRKIIEIKIIVFYRIFNKYFMYSVRDL